MYKYRPPSCHKFLCFGVDPLTPNWPQGVKSQDLVYRAGTLSEADPKRKAPKHSDRHGPRVLH